MQVTQDDQTLFTRVPLPMDLHNVIMDHLLKSMQAYRVNFVCDNLLQILFAFTENKNHKQTFIIISNILVATVVFL